MKKELVTRRPARGVSGALWLLAAGILSLAVLCPPDASAASDSYRQRQARQRREQYRKQQEAQRKRREASIKAFETKKAKEGLRDWSLTGTLRGTGSIVQFIPDRETGGVDKEIGAMMIGGSTRTELESLFGRPLNELSGRKVQLDFYGEPKRSGSSLTFNPLSGDVQRWRRGKVLN